MRNFLQARFLRMRRFLAKPLVWKKTFSSPVFSYPAEKLRKQWGNFLNQSFPYEFHPWFKFLGRWDQDRKFEHLPLGKSQMQNSLEIQSNGFFQKLLQITFHQTIQRRFQKEEERMLEFAHYLQGEKSLASYRKFRRIKNPILRAERLHLNHITARFRIANLDALDGFLSPNFTYPSNRGKVTLLLIKNRVRSLEFPGYEEEFDLPSDILPYFWDAFIQAWAVSQNEIQWIPNQPKTIYLGSYYSHETIAQHCKDLRLDRKLLPIETVKSIWENLTIANPHPTSTTGQSMNSIKMNSEPSRYRFSGNYVTEIINSTEIGNPSTLSKSAENQIQWVWEGGFYSLDKNFLDESPLIFPKIN